MPAPPLSHHLLSALMFLHEESKWEAWGAVFLSLAVPFFVAFLCLCVFHSVSLRSPISFSASENSKQKHNSESSNKSTWFLWLFICFPLIFFFSSSCPTLGKLRLLYLVTNRASIHLQPLLPDSETSFGQATPWLLGLGSAGRAVEDQGRECRSSGSGWARDWCQWFRLCCQLESFCLSHLPEHWTVGVKSLP